MKKLIFPLIAVLFLSQPLAVAAAADMPVEPPTETAAEEEGPAYPDSYYWPAQTDDIPGWPASPSIEAEAAVLMDARTGHLLYAKNKNTKHYPASITKIMTTLLALEHCDNLRETVTFSAEAVHTEEANSSTIWAVEGEKLRMNQCLFAVMLASANEVAYAVAEQSCGSLKRFVEEMNTRAKELGCTGTHFNNASGLPDERHYTTAYDMALIAREAWQNRWFRKLAGTVNYTIPKTNKTKEPRELYNHHKMLLDSEYQYKGCVGGKTGYTTQAGNTLVTYVRRGSVTLIAVVLKSTSAGAVYSDTKAILDYGFDNFHRVSVPLKGTQTVTLNLLPNVRYALPNGGVYDNTFAYEHGYAVVPKGVEEKDLITRRYYVPNLLGNWKVYHNYYYNDWMVGTGEAYVLPSMAEHLFEAEE